MSAIIISSGSSKETNCTLRGIQSRRHDPDRSAVDWSATWQRYNVLPVVAASTSHPRADYCRCWRRRSGSHRGSATAPGSAARCAADRQSRAVSAGKIPRNKTDQSAAEEKWVLELKCLQGIAQFAGKMATFSDVFRSSRQWKLLSENDGARTSTISWQWCGSKWIR